MQMYLIYFLRYYGKLLTVATQQIIVSYLQGTFIQGRTENQWFLVIDSTKFYDIENELEFTQKRMKRAGSPWS